ncbi:MAG: orotidine-5'-phosphate decarboxylase [Candidatus Saganbacteria bacterium]|uniref:Orotidine 5'-phosphate decarboxylase n=1 Tax=Candidatus Saganbacteria bacterium TaxID=2575572 RepID=A0A833L094_UNCSA|nr:MAG: orotidine-5'-phosphate decarboxylase [Candidatus Saganbacteria bacterium]
MNFLEKLDKSYKKNKSQLCIGLDIDIRKLPKDILDSEDPIFNFNRYIIDQTTDLVCAYKPNIAFYEALGIYGLESLIHTIEYISPTGIPVILDAKRGDVGHTAAAYAKAIFDVYKADAATVNPYMGHDSVEPFINYRDKGVFVLCLTSNIGVKDFQTAGREEPLYISVAKHVKEWNHYGNCGLVVGATIPNELKEIKKIVGNMPILIPGVGAQGGDLKNSIKYGGQRAIINASRSIIYSDNPKEEAKKLRDQILEYSE